ncbi:MAG: hypothetical protein K8W52_22655, partial [Deltaproteobacteria bacterium]|nr:hypothetical protein [Deltaproteobacteria bacterium]
MTARWTAGFLRGIAVAVPAAAAVIGLAAPDSVLWGGAAWLGFLIAVLAGWGSLVERAAKVEVDLGLRLAWGAAGLLAAGGVLLAAGRLDVYGFDALLAIGFLGHAWRQITVREPTVTSLGRALGTLREDPQAAILWTALGALALVNILGAIAHLKANVYDDDIAYTPFVRRLLDAGNLVEPFSFRRVSAFGGQTVLSALAAVRGTLSNIYLVDHGLFQLVTLALVAGMVRQRDRFVGALAILVLLLLPDASINTASYWTGVALFLALYRTVAHVLAAPRAGFAVAGLVAAATCTLRQNYLPVAIGFLALTLLFRLRRPLVPALRADRAAWLGALVGGLVGLLPYLIASWRSNETFLYPFQLGTFNPDIQMTPTVWSIWQELQFFLSTLLEPDPLRVAVPLIPMLLLCRDRRPGRPMTALTLASIVGFVLLVHAFTLSDPRNLWRYAFGFVVALTMLLAIEGTADGFDGAPPPGTRPSLPTIGRFWVIACLLAQLLATGKSTARKYAVIGAELSAAARDLSPDTGATPEAAYQRLQAAAPAGATIVVLLDQPAYLDFARNPIINLDTPGFASYRPGMPAFRGAEPVAAYFRDHGLRYLAFVRGDRSTYFYRREYWVQRLFTDTELWRILAAYMIDTIDNFAALADRYPVLYEE